MGAACGATCGVTRERERQRIEARALARKAWSAGLRGRPAWWPETPPFADDEPRRLDAAFSDALPCRTLLENSASAWGASWLWLVASVSEATWAEYREGRCERPDGPSRETALRVGLSSLGRFATLQQCDLVASVDARGTYLEERRCPGVEDRRLQPFVKAVQGILRRQRIVCLDAAFLADALDESDPAADGLWNALFDPEPMTLSVVTFLPDASVAVRGR